MIGTGSGRFPGTGRACWMNSTGNLETPASSKASCSECWCHWLLRLKRRIRHTVCWETMKCPKLGTAMNFHELSRSKMIQVLVSVSSVVVDQLGAGIHRIDQGVKGIDLESLHVEPGTLPKEVWYGRTCAYIISYNIIIKYNIIYTC